MSVISVSNNKGGLNQWAPYSFQPSHDFEKEKRRGKIGGVMGKRRGDLSRRYSHG